MAEICCAVSLLYFGMKCMNIKQNKRPRPKQNLNERNLLLNANKVLTFYCLLLYVPTQQILIWCKKLDSTISCKILSSHSILKLWCLSPVRYILSHDVSILKWSPTFNTWAALFTTTVGCILRSIPGSARPHPPSNHHTSTKSAIPRNLIVWSEEHNPLWVSHLLPWHLCDCWLWFLGITVRQKCHTTILQDGPRRKQFLLRTTV